MLQKNMGTIDRSIRVIISVSIWALHATGRVDGIISVILGMVGGTILATAVLGYCPLYLPFNFSTKRD